MKDVRIVTVAWNVDKLMQRMLDSLPAACAGLSWECVVVDNDSHDQSVKVVQRIAAADARYSLIEAKANLGFAKACNLGAAGADARYVLFLNPDTECPAMAISKLVKAGDANPTAGIFGPKLMYPNGDIQASVRRFPTVWNQAGILLKLHHLFSRLPTFKNYFATDLDQDLEQDVDQVMGACFLVRRELLEQKLGFDERYFIWFEEVDFCKTAKENGWATRYLPKISVIHHGGQSFGQVFSPKKQKYFDESVLKFFKKWQPGWRVLLLQILHPIALALSWLISFLKTEAGKWTLLVLTLELLSLVSIYQSTLDTLFAILTALLVLFVAWKRPALALCGLLLELLIGSKGALLQAGVFPHTISLRILITAAFGLGWFGQAIQQRTLHSTLSRVKTYWPYAVLYLVIGYAFVRGWSIGNGANVVKDGNAWLELALLLPALDIFVRDPHALRKHIPSLLAVAISWLAIKTLAVEYVFSHGFSFDPYVYPWIRRTGVGEITLVAGNFFRVFFQSHIYSTLAVVATSCALLFQVEPAATSDADVARTKQLRWLLALSISALVINLSRSMWVGVIVGVGLVKLLAFSHKKFSFRSALKVGGTWFAGFVLAIAVVMFPLPRVDLASLADVFGSRTDSSEAAVVSRWNLLHVLEQKIAEHPLIGSGFGTTVTYETKDPRIVRQSGGTYTTYAYEWGWLEHWVKFGLIGIPLILGILLWLGWRLWKSPMPLWQRAASISVLLTLAVIHVFTPYLNHPLGFTVLLFGESLLIFYAQRDLQTKT